MDCCLYCENVPQSEEHPLPAALGEFRGGPTLPDRVCKKCNESRIGILDEQFMRCGPPAVLRKKFNIQGRQHHQRVNPFYRGSAGGKRVEVSAWDDKFQCQVLLEPTGGQEGRHLTQLILKDQSGNYHHLPLTESMTLEQLRDQVRSLQLEFPLPEAGLICDLGNETWAQDLFRALWPQSDLPEPKLGTTVFRGAVAEFRLTNRYFRAVAKIGFHYFLTQFPRFTGRESIFDDVRKFIVDDSKELGPEQINRFVGIHQFPIAPPGPTFVGHLLCAEIKDGLCISHIELFLSPGGRMQPYRVTLGFDPELREDELHAHLYTYDEQGKVGKFSGQALEIGKDLCDLGVLQRSVVYNAVT